MDIECAPVACPCCGSNDKIQVADKLPNLKRKGSTQLFSFSECKACGLAYLDPRPVRLSDCYESDYEKHEARDKKPSAWKIFSRHLMHRIYLGYPPSPGPLGAAMKTFWKKRWEEYSQKHGHMLIPWAGTGKGRLLDVGSGAGDKTVKYAHVGWKVTGVETTAEAAEQGRKVHGLDIRAGTLEEQKFPDESFDAAVLNCVLEHVPAPVELLKEVYRLLAPKGVAVIDVPNFESKLRETFGPAWTQYSIPEHFSIPTEKTLRMMAERAGFKVLKIEHRCSMGLYQLAQATAKTLNVETKGLPTAKPEIEAWFANECPSPKGELMLMWAEKSP
jgi:SAM-dependent methyltransferase